MAHRRGLVFIIVVLIFGMTRLFSMAECSAQTSQQDWRMVQPGWKVFRGQTGLVVFHPGGWKIEERKNGAFLACRPGSGGGATALALVEPIEKIDGRTTGVVLGLGQIFPELFPNVKIIKSRLISHNPEVALAEIRYAPRGQPFMGMTLCFKKENRGVLYVIAASKPEWPQAEPVMKQILSGFFYSGGTTSVGGSLSTAGLPSMVSWNDPREGAFTLPVPQGWKVEGGLIRFTSIDYREDIQVTSPDNQIFVRRGDSRIPFGFRLPTSAYFAEGNWYAPDGIHQHLVMRYLPGASFLTELYLPRLVGPVTNVRAQNYPEIAQRIMIADAQSGLRYQRTDIGDVSFEAQTEMGLRKGYGLAQTTLVSLAWRVSLFLGYLAAPSVEQEAGAVLHEMFTGFRTNPDWFARQLGQTAKVSQMIRQTDQEIGDMIYQGHVNRSRSMDRSHERWTRAFRGQVLIEDTDTQQRFEVPSGSNYYWRAGAGNEFVGTETSSPDLPGYWLQHMKMID